MVRKQRDARYEASSVEAKDDIDANTVMENPLPKPHRMKSNATFQPKRNLIEPNLTVDK